MDQKMASRVAVRYAVILALIALILGFLHLYSIREAPQSLVPVLDEEAYDAQANGILSGTWPGENVFYQDPLYPYFLALTYKITGHHIIAPKILQVILGAISVLLVFGIGNRAFSPGVGVLAALFLTLYRPLYFFEGVLTKELLGLALVCASLYCLLRMSDENKIWKWFLPGLLLGAACLARANLLLVIPAWSLWILLSVARKGRGLSGVFAAAVFCSGALVAISPVTIHNMNAGDFVLVTSQGGQNFYIGNHPKNLSGTYRSPPFVRGNPRFEQADFRRHAERKCNKSMKPSEISSFWYAETWRHIKDSPKDFFRRVWRKTLLVLNNYEISDNINFYFFRLRYSKVLRLPTPGWGIMAALALTGMLILVFRLWRDPGAYEPKTSPLILFAILYSASLVAFYVFSRYRLPLLAVIAPLAAFCLVSFVKYLKGHRIGMLLAGLAVAGLLMTASFKSLIKPGFDEAYFQTGNCLLTLKRSSEAEKEYRQAVRLVPDRARYRTNLATALGHQGKYKEALEQYRIALALEPKNPYAHHGIANIFYDMSDYAAACTHYERALLYGGEMAVSLRQLGRTYQKLGREAEAIRCFEKVRESKDQKKSQ